MTKKLVMSWSCLKGPHNEETQVTAAIHIQRLTSQRA